MSEALITLNVFKVFGLSALAFFFAFFSAPLLTYYLYKHKAWKPVEERKALSGEDASVVSNFYRSYSATPKPRMGGILIWGTVAIISVLFWIFDTTTPLSLFDKLNFVSRGQTWLPIAALIAAALVGLVDDMLVVRKKGSYLGGGLSLRIRITLVLIIGLIGALWFYGPLEARTLFVPFIGDVTLGIFIIPLFMLVMLALFSSGVVDGMDGLAGGVLATMIVAYGGIAFFQQQFDIAALMGVTGGALLAFLWYNIPPARFIMGETGILGLTVMITVVAFLTGAVAVLPVIGFILVLETGSVIIQVVSKKWRGKKVFHAAPIHHHFEVKGWPPYKVTMRFWVVSIVAAFVGMVIHLIG